MTNIETVSTLSGAAVTQPLGDVGESCRRCGVELASDQRYCINCGERRAAARVEYRELLGACGRSFGPKPGRCVRPVATARGRSGDLATRGGGRNRLAALGGTARRSDRQG